MPGTFPQSSSSLNIAFLPLKPRVSPPHPCPYVLYQRQAEKKRAAPGKRKAALISTFSCSSGKPKRDHLAHEIVIDRPFCLRQIVLSRCSFTVIRMLLLAVG
ncbi:hypothetical protein AVEN_203444-1 [Araneus ventricosus]|uniref:Uncharacterized protein n=1 Tax=Araneus ventricosus TaxID=182803 RepID=A0A4Y2BHT3_ARAVE|nr:hypothetical protein AVEN_203444-1 [Araneus ventricosus]